MTTDNSVGPDQQHPVAAVRKYEVGYKRPPQATQFKPGQSGNPKGRPKGTRTLADLRRELYSAPVQVRDGDKIRKIPRVLAADIAIFNRALKGDVRAASLVDRNAKELGFYDNPTPPQDTSLTDAEIESLSDEDLFTMARIIKKARGLPPD